MRQSSSRWRQMLASSRLLVIIAVLGTLAGAVALLIYGTIEVVVVVGDALRAGVSTRAAKSLMLGVIEVTDLFLLGVVLFIVALGLCALFVDDTLPLPHWLESKTSTTSKQS